MSWTNWLRRNKLEQGLDRELQYHLERRIDDLQKTGLSIGEARRQARLEMGGVEQIQEEVRDVWLTRWLRDFFYDLRFSFRSFLKTPSFSITAVLSLMFGIGATTAIYSLVDQALLHALPVREPERLVLIDWKGDQAGSGFGSWNLMSYPICRDLDRQKQLFEGAFCRALTTVNLSTGGDYHPVSAELVSGNYFQVLGVGAAMGRVVSSEDDAGPGANPVAVVSYDFWKNQLAGATDIVGRKVLLNRHPVSIIGVAAASFKGIDFGEVPSLWIPASLSSQAIPGFDGMLSRRLFWMQVLGRLRQDVSLKQAQMALQPWFKAMLREDMKLADFPVISEERRQRFLNSHLELTAAPGGHSWLRRLLAQPLWVLFSVTAVLLCLACLNVSGLFLARGSAREREIGTRLALGASRGRLGRQLLTDSLLIAIVGGVLATAAAPLVVRTLLALLPQRDVSNSLHAGTDLRVLLFSLAASLVAGLLSGLAPAWHAGRRSLITSLRERGGSEAGGSRTRRVIVTAQIALTLTLVVGAALFVRTLNALMTKGPGFNTTSLVSFGIYTMRNGYTPEEGERVIGRIEEAIRQSSIVQTSAVIRFGLLTGGSWNNPMTILAGKLISTDREANLNSVTPGFFDAMGIHLLAGRGFTEHDVRTGKDDSWRSAIVSQSFVKRYLGARNPLGVLICQGTGPSAKPNIEIVGVMADFSYRGVREDSEQVYFPFFEGEHSFGTFYVRVRGKPESSFAALQAIVKTVDPALPLSDLRTVDEQVNRSLNPERILATLSGGFGTLALLLSVVGLYGVMSFVVNQRTREIGIRLALGAERSSAVWLIMRDALTIVGRGIGIGLVFVWVSARLIESQLYEVKPADPAALASAILVLCLAAAGAALIPAYRASSVNPTTALRAE